MSFLFIGTGIEAFAYARRLETPGPRLAIRPSVVGQGTVGATLRADAGSWEGDPTPVLSFRWLRDGTPLPEQTGPEYIIRPEDRGALLCCYVEAENSNGGGIAATPLIPVWPNRTTLSWQIDQLGGAEFEIRRAPGGPDPAEVTFDDGTIVIADH